MIEKIENEFKKKIKYNIKSHTLTFLFIFLIIISLIISKVCSIYWLFITPSLFILCACIYIFIIVKIKIRDKIKINKMFEIYKRMKNDENRKFLLNILKNNNVKLRIEIDYLISYYQNKIPKKIFESSQFLSILALLSSFFFFVIDPDFSTVEEKLSMILVFVILISIIYLCVYLVIKEIKDIYSADNFNIMMEKYLIEIVVKDIVK